MTNTTPTCSICLQDLGFSSGAVTDAGCQHCFHKDCISSWSEIKSACPLCKQPFRFVIDFFEAEAIPVSEPKPKQAPISEEFYVEQDLYPCGICDGHSHPDLTLICDDCGRCYHTFCLSPPLFDIPEGDWFCPQCIMMRFRTTYGTSTISASPASLNVSSATTSRLSNSAPSSNEHVTQSSSEPQSRHDQKISSQSEDSQSSRLRSSRAAKVAAARSISTVLSYEQTFVDSFDNFDPSDENYSSHESEPDLTKTRNRRIATSRRSSRRVKSFRRAKSTRRAESTRRVESSRRRPISHLSSDHFDASDDGSSSNDEPDVSSDEPDTSEDEPDTNSDGPDTIVHESDTASQRSLRANNKSECTLQTRAHKRKRTKRPPQTSERQTRSMTFRKAAVVDSAERRSSNSSGSTTSGIHVDQRAPTVKRPKSQVRGPPTDQSPRADCRRKDWQCGECDRGYVHRRSLERHVKRIHSQKTEAPKLHKCTICGKKLKTLNWLRRHGRTVHSKVRYMCETCGKEFRKRRLLNIHQKVHSANKPYKCLECGKEFRWEGSWRRHHNRCAGGIVNKPYVCGTCGKAFSYRYTLDEHRRIHSGLKPHICDKCGKSFSRAGNLKRHERNVFYCA